MFFDYNEEDNHKWTLRDFDLRGFDLSNFDITDNRHLMNLQLMDDLNNEMITCSVCKGELSDDGYCEFCGRYE